jgi:hypothetical protein
MRLYLPFLNPRLGVFIIAYAWFNLKLVPTNSLLDLRYFWLGVLKLIFGAFERLLVCFELSVHILDESFKLGFYVFETHILGVYNFEAAWHLLMNMEFAVT